MVLTTDSSVLCIQTRSFIEEADAIRNDLSLIVLRVLYPAIDKNRHAFRMLVGFDTLSEAPYREL